MIILNNLCKMYKECVALDDCNLKFNNNGFIAITGYSGSGKTTLLNLIGMIDSPTSGEVIFDDNEIYTSDVERTEYRKQNIGYVFQDAIMLEQLTVKDNILLPLNVAGVRSDSQYFYDLIKELGIEELMSRKVNELSAGQKQRIAIARAMICKPKIILADEPTGNLDEKTTTDVFNILKKISKEILVLVVTHNRTMAMQYADRVLEMKFGKIISDQLIDSTCNEVTTEIKTNIRNQKEKKRSFYLSWANFVIRKRKAEKIIGITVLTILICALGMNFVLVSKENSMNVEKYFLDTNLLVVKENMHDNITAYLSSQFSADKFMSDMSFLSNDNRLEDIVENFELTGIVISGDNEVKFKNVSSINIDDYFRERFKTTQIEGSFLRQDNEMILSKEIAKAIYPTISYNDCIGKSVTLSGNYFKESFVIVGINTHEDVTGNIVSYVTSKAAKRISEHEMQENTSAVIYSDNCYKINKTVDGNDIFIKDSAKAEMVNYSEYNNYDLLYGKKELADGEILLSIGVIQDFGVLFGDDFQLQGDQISQEQLNIIFSTKLLCVLNNSAYFKVVGIYKDNINELSLITTEKDKKNLLKVLPTEMNLYIKDATDISDMTTYLKSKGFDVNSPYSYFKDAVGSRMSSITYIFTFLVMFMTLITVLIIYTFAKHNILDSTKDIGLLKAIGASKTYIMKVYAQEAFITGIISGIIAVVIFPLTTTLFNYLFENGYINIMTSPLQINYIQMIIILFSGVMLFIVSTLPALLKISKLDAVTTIKNIG